jgi:hypothetical protein
MTLSFLSTNYAEPHQLPTIGNKVKNGSTDCRARKSTSGSMTQTLLAFSLATALQPLPLARLLRRRVHSPGHNAGHARYGRSLSDRAQSYRTPSAYPPDPAGTSCALWSIEDCGQQHLSSCDRLSCWAPGAWLSWHCDNSTCEQARAKSTHS